MSEIIPVDLVNVFLGSIKASDKQEDGKLHPSGDLCGSLRHTMLRLAGVKEKPRPVAQDIRLMHGTLWHEWFHNALEKAGVPFMYEVDLTEYLPEGWAGTADWVFFNPERNAYALGDLKTSKGEAMYWIDKKGAKDEHIWQLSAYWHALVRAGWPMLKGFGVLYWPMNDVSNDTIVPTVQDCDPIDGEIIRGRMEERWQACQEYLQETKGNNILNDKLAPEMERQQKFVWDKTREIFNVSLYPHWLTAFCPYQDEYCACDKQSVTKIGHYTLDGEYVPRKGYDDIKPTVRPEVGEFLRRRKSK